MSKKHLLLIIILFLISTAGCWDRREINASAIPMGIGIDISDDKKIIFSTLFAKPTSPGEAGGGQMKTILSSSQDYGVAIAARRINLSLSLVPDWSHVQTFVLGENLSMNALPLVIDFMSRNRNIRPDTNLVITSGTSPKEILSQVSTVGGGLKQLVSVNEFQMGIYVPTTIDEFTYKLMTPGIEPAVPQLIIEETPGINQTKASGDKNPKPTDNNKKRIALHGTAVFKGNKMVGSLNETESSGYRWLSSDTKIGGLLTVKSPLNQQDYVVLEIVRFSSKTKPQLSGGSLKMQVEIDAQLNFYEQSGSGELLTPTMINKLEKAANVEIARQIDSCINKSQQLNSDIPGWGLKLYEYQPDEWQRLSSDWNELYPFIEADVRVKTSISQFYLADKSFKFQ